MYQPYNLSDVRKSADRKRFTVIDTFAGGGGTSTGMKLAGGHELMVNEFVEVAAEAFSVNYPDVIVSTDDIKNLSGKDFLEPTGLAPGELDIFSGGPPCSAFSINGDREKGWNKTKSYSTGKKVTNIEDLFFEFLRVADEIKPRVIIAENVKGLTLGDANAYLNQVLNEMRSMGYFAAVKLLKACDFNTPQLRERCFIIGVRKDVAKKAGIGFMGVGKLFPTPAGPVCKIKEAFENLDQPQEDVDYLLGHFKSISKYDLVMKHLKLGPKKPTRLSDAAGVSSFFNCHRLSLYTPSPTLTVVGSAPSLSNYIHPLEQRALSVHEFKRVMGSPDDYYCGDKLSHQYERIARMVAPRVMEAIATNIYEKVLVHDR